MNRLCLLPLLAALTLPLAACGNKGDLFLPPPPPTVVDDETGRPVEATDEAGDDADATPQDEAADDARDAADEPAQALPLPPPPLPVEEDDGAGDDGA